ncbi:MAG: thiopurine S-methyltransferase [Pseudomonadota bacterium]
MDAAFWHERWETGRIAFHEAEGNALFAAHFSALKLSAGARVFVPLCGKTKDIGWLLSQGYRVCAVELSQLAIDQLFEELELIPNITQTGELLHYRAANIDVFVGDAFALTADILGPVDAVYDRAALVALPFEMRAGYGRLLNTVTRGASQLLLTFIYDQSQLDGPPFSVDDAEVARVYGAHYTIMKSASVPLAGGLRGFHAIEEVVWRLEAIDSGHSTDT